MTLISFILISSSVSAIDCKTLFKKLRFSIYHMTTHVDNGVSFNVYVQGYNSDIDEMILTFYRISDRWRPSQNIKWEHILHGYVDKFRLSSMQNGHCQLDDLNEPYQTIQAIDFEETYFDLLGVHFENISGGELFHHKDEDFFLKLIYNADLLLSE